MDVSRLFKSKTRKAIFKLYFTNPEAEYYLRELERTIDIPVSMVRKELQQLEKEGVFVSHKRGNLVYYHINKTYPLFAELKSIVSKTIGIQGLLKEMIRKVKGIDVAFIYGSFARNSENATSDIDLLVIGNPNEDELVREINGIEKTIAREINYILYSMAEFKKKRRQRDSFVLDLLENPKIFLIGDKNDL